MDVVMQFTSDPSPLVFLCCDQPAVYVGQRLLGELLVRDIDAGPDEPSKCAIRQESGYADIEDPAIFTVMPAKTTLFAEWALGRKPFVGNPEAPLDVIRMCDRRPSELKLIFQRSACKVSPALIEVDGLSVTPDHPNHHRRTIGHQSETFFGLALPGLSALAFGNIRENAGSSIDAVDAFDREIRDRHVSLANIGIRVFHLVSDYRASKALVESRFDGLVEDPRIQYVTGETPHHLVSCLIPHLEKRAIREQISVVPIHNHDHFFETFHRLLVCTELVLSQFLLVAEARFLFLKGLARSIELNGDERKVGSRLNQLEIALLCYSWRGVVQGENTDHSTVLRHEWLGPRR